MMLIRSFLTALMLGLIAIVSSQVASAQVCTSSTTLGFGTIDLTSGGAFTTSGTMTVSCFGTANTTVRTCPSLGSGTGTSDPGGSVRYMDNGSGGLLGYHLYADSGYSQVWGSISGTMSSFPPPAIDIALGAGGSGSASRPIYARVFPSQQTTPAGSYQSSFSSNPDFILAALTNGTGQTCAEIGNANQGFGSLTISANYVPVCTLLVNPLAFGALTSTVTAKDSTTTIEARCSAGTPYTVAMNNGSSGAVDPALREMKNGANSLYYGIYRDLNRIQIWGETPGVDVRGGTGTGLTASIDVYGRVQPQATPPSGNYADSVIVTINY